MSAGWQRGGAASTLRGCCLLLWRGLEAAPGGLQAPAQGNHLPARPGLPLQQECEHPSLTEPCHLRIELPCQCKASPSWLLLCLLPQETTPSHRCTCTCALQALVQDLVACSSSVSFSDQLLSWQRCLTHTAAVEPSVCHSLQAHWRAASGLRVCMKGALNCHTSLLQATRPLHGVPCKG